MPDSPEGVIIARVGSLGTPDREGDVILRGAVGRQEVFLSRWNHSSKRLFGELPVGGGVIYEQGDTLMSEVSYLMHIPAAREAYETVKGLGSMIQWSIAHRPVKWDFLQDGEMIHRHLSEITVSEVSPVDIGAAADTRTLTVKSARDAYVRDRALADRLDIHQRRANLYRGERQ